ncbi:MAG: hypothetical protein P4L84_36935 [Isosphaeraceae bacterium]|nr:hypothetical protein [Isosphaeraceae bacterium]
MRKALLVGLAIATFAVAAGAEPPIPQDTARMEQRRRERLEWNRRTLAGAYDKVGKHDARWDKSAREALDLTARMYSDVVDPEVGLDDMYKPAKAAVDAGCDDPLVVFLYDRALVGPRFPGDVEMARRMKDAGEALAKSRYPVFRRAIGRHAVASYLLSVKDLGEADRKQAERDLDATLALLPESAASDERTPFWEDVWLDVVNGVIRDYRKLGVDPKAAYERTDAALAKVPALKPMRLKVRGTFWVQYGWEARTTAVAALVSQGGAEKFIERLGVAREAFEDAWRLRPGDAQVAAYLLDIDKAVGGDHATMERWFERAMTADGDRYGACSSKLDWLDPKWHGTPEEMLAFGRACRATKNWRVGITLLAADAHVRYSSRMPPAEREKYLGSPAVWSEIQAVFDEYLEHHPSHDNQRSRYAVVAVMAHKYPEAHAQFQVLGDRLTTWSGVPYLPSFAEVKRARDSTARALALEASGAARLPWVRFGGRNNEGAWSVNVPGKPQRRQDPGILGARARNVFAATTGGVTYTVRVQPVPPAALKPGTQAVLDAARTALAKEYGGKPRDERPATLAEQPAQDFAVDAPGPTPAAVRVRVGLIGNRLYELSVSGSAADVANPAADLFLDSFKFE